MFAHICSPTDELQKKEVYIYDFFTFMFAINLNHVLNIELYKKSVYCTRSNLDLFPVRFANKYWFENEPKFDEVSFLKINQYFNHEMKNVQITSFSYFF